MPTHAIPPGRGGRSHRRATRRGRLLYAWQRLPSVLLLITCLHVAGMPLLPESNGLTVTMAVVAARAGLLGGLLMCLVLVIVVALGPRVNRWRGSAADPRPRWQYLFGALGWLVVATCWVLLSFQLGAGLPARTTTAVGIWSGVYGLVLMGRAASWGRVRALLWWGPIKWS
jgi:hypothetical protein